MKKYICFALMISISNLIFSQDIIINGVNKNRLLNWEDFKGPPDQSMSYDAYTHWNINYTSKGISFKGDTAKVAGFSVTLTFNENLSWVKPEKQTGYLLKHEQGHFDIGLICQQEIIKQLSSTVFFKTGFQEKIQSVFSSVLDKYRLLGIKYDEETDHSKNKTAQNTWNGFFDTELK